MKKLTTLCLAVCLAAALATPAGALDYTIDAPDGPDYSFRFRPSCGRLRPRGFSVHQ